MTTLYALSRDGDQLSVKRVQVAQPVQAKIQGIFQGQATAFLDGISEEIEFNGSWKPDANELLVLNIPDEVQVISEAVQRNALALPTINPLNFTNENIKALFIVDAHSANQRFLIQLFTVQQILARRFSLWLDGETFNELTAPAFALDNFLVAIIENGRLKFRSFFNVKRIFTLSQLYQEASDQQIDNFCAHQNLVVADLAAFKAAADQVIRKLVHAIVTTGVLDQHSVDSIKERAILIDIDIVVSQNKIILPLDRKTLKQVLHFLDDGIYKAALSSKKYITNSKRPAE